MTVPYRILLVSGSLRAASTNTAVLRSAQVLAPGALEAVLYGGLGDLPHFSPDLDVAPLPEPVAALRVALADADAVLVSTPEYAGALPGSFKNLFDWAVGGGQLNGKPVAWINTATSSTGAADAHRSLRTVLGYCGAVVVEAASGHLPVDRTAIGPDGLLAEPGVSARLVRMLSALACYLDGPAPRATDEAIGPRGIHHVSLNVDDVPAALAFCVEDLGLTIRSDRPVLPFDGAWLDAGPQQVHLIAATPPPGHGQHFALLVGDVEAVVARLRRRGHSVTNPAVVGTSRQSFLSDPAGNMVELHERP